MQTVQFGASTCQMKIKYLKTESLEERKELRKERKIICKVCPYMVCLWNFSYSVELDLLSDVYLVNEFSWDLYSGDKGQLFDSRAEMLYDFTSINMKPVAIWDAYH